MYMIEITEDKIDNLIEHASKVAKCIHKMIESLEEMKDDGYNDDYEDYDRSERHGSRDKYKMGGRGRYDRY